ncbi:MAG TPA: GxxExxY protein [Candidatus Paceibacterota bacterium]|nr:GxxExxY protein [Candidatus Paceibacterota bacterium]
MAIENGKGLLYEKVSYHIGGACFDTYNKFGGAFKESVINDAFVIELRNRELSVETEKRITIFHDDEKIGGLCPRYYRERSYPYRAESQKFLNEGG